MYNRTDIIHNLESCLAIQCDDCMQEHASHYPLDCEAYDSFVRSAVELLKAQEPRILALDEIKEGEPYWFEVSGDFVRPVICLHREDDAIKKYITFVWQYGTSSWEMEEYNVGWRCWSARPTKEQRKVAKWND